MRILAVANRYPPWSRGGYEVMSAGAVAALREAGHEVRVLTTLPDPSDQAPGEPSDPAVHRELRWYWRDHRFPPIGLRATIALERDNARLLERRVRDFRPDVVLWLAMGGMSLSLLERPRRLGVPAVGVVGDEWMLYGPGVDGWIRRWRGRRAMAAPIAQKLTGIPAAFEPRAAARWIFISEHLRSAAAAAGLCPAEAPVMHPGIDPSRFPKREPGIWQWRLLYSGRIDSRKGIATAVEALPLLPAEATLRIDGPGDPSYASELAQLADRLGVTHRCHLQCSAPERIPDAYAGADAVVFPVTWREPWGLVPLEAMATGRPVVASAAGGGPAEYLRHRENCLQFPPGNAGALASALEELASDAALRERLIAGGLKTASGFTDRQFHDALARELEQAVREAGAAPSSPPSQRPEPPPGRRPERPPGRRPEPRAAASRPGRPPGDAGAARRRRWGGVASRRRRS